MRSEKLVKVRSQETTGYGKKDWILFKLRNMTWLKAKAVSRYDVWFKKVTGLFVISQ